MAVPLPPKRTWSQRESTQRCAVNHLISIASAKLPNKV